MTPAALALVLTAAVFHAIWNLAAKAKTGDSFVFIWWYVLGRTLRENVWPILAIAAFSPAAYVLVLIAMQTQPVSLVAPLGETSIVIGSLLGWLIFKEANPGRRLLGAAVVLGGVALISG